MSKNQLTSPSDSYHIAIDCIDRHCQHVDRRNKTALISVERESGKEPRVTKLSFANLRGLTNRFTNLLTKKGFKTGDRLILRLPNSPLFPIAFAGAMKAGVIPIPTSPLLTADELTHILEDSQAEGLMTIDELVSFSHPLKTTTDESAMMLNHLFKGAESADPQKFFRYLKNESGDFEVIPVNPDDSAYWLYTSGTEGKPKGVIHAHRSIPAHDERVRQWQDLKYGDVVFNTSALNWSYALTAGMFDIWRHAATVVTYQGAYDPEQICKVIRDFKVTVFMSVPGIYRRIVRFLKSNASLGFAEARSKHEDACAVKMDGSCPSKSFDLPALSKQSTQDQTIPRATRRYFSTIRVALSAGEALSEEIRNSFEELTRVKIREGLGMTEHSVYLIQPHDEEPVTGSCGRPLSDQQIAVLRDDLTPCDPGEVGILATHRGCAGLMLGYHGQSDSDTFSDDWFLSGDLARYDEQGNYYFEGRRDDIITAGGYRISPLEVEAVLNQHPDVLESAVIGVTEGDKIFVVAYIVSQVDGSCPSESFDLPVSQNKNTQDQTIPQATRHNDIISYTKKYLSAYKVPRQIFFCDSLPKTVTGKIKRNRLDNR